MIEILPNWHPIFVHFTVALLTVAVALYLLVRILPASGVRQELAIVARWSLWIGAALAVATATAGWLAYNSVAHDDISHAAMTEHRNWALATAALFIMLALWSGARWWKQHPSEGGTGIFFLMILAVGGVLLASTAWHGAELVYRYGLGVMALPKVEVEETAHGHAQQNPDTSLPVPSPVHDHSTHKHTH